jgi:hypothetical protein
LLTPARGVVTCAARQVESHEKPACVGLLHCLSEIDLARTQMCETKPVPPHPAINCINLFFDTLETDRNSMATEVRACVAPHR